MTEAGFSMDVKRQRLETTYDGDGIGVICIVSSLNGLTELPQTDIKNDDRKCLHIESVHKSMNIVRRKK